MPPEGTFPRFSESTLTQYDKNNEIWFGKDGTSKPSRKTFLSELTNEGVPSNTLWLHVDVGNNHEAKTEIKLFNSDDVFDTPKPEKLIQRILTLATNPNDLVLDSFLGSGTTAAVAHKMGRRYIGIEMGEHAKTHVIPRLQKVIDGEQGGISKVVNWQGGGSFSFYTLGNAVFDEQGFLNPEVKFKDLASYAWWLETKTALHVKNDFSNPFLGVFENIAYYLLYNGILGDRRPNGGNVLTMPILNYLNECHAHTGKRIIIGEASRLGTTRLSELNIEFKQIPYTLFGSKPHGKQGN